MAKNQSDKLVRRLFMLIPILGLACLAISIGIAIDQGAFSLWTEIGVLAGIVLFLAIFVKAEVANLKYYLNVFVYSALVFGICVVGYLFARQYKPQIDLTESQIYSLDPQTKRFLHGLNQDVEVIFFSDADTISRTMRRDIHDIETLYANETPRIKFEYLNSVRDVEKTLKRATQLNLTNPSALDVVVKSGAKTKRIGLGDIVRNYENTMNNAIIEVTATGSAKVYFTTGHGEFPLNAPKPRSREETQQQAQNSLMLFKGVLEYAAIPSEPLDLLAKGSVPEDATAIVIAGPSSDFTEPEIAQLRAYLDKGGRLMVAVGPSLRPQHDKLERLTGMLRDYGIDLPDTMVFDQVARRIGNWANPIVQDFDPKHAITAELNRETARFQVVLARPVGTAPVKDNRIQAVDLIKTSAQSFTFPVDKLLEGQPAAPASEAEVKSQTIGVAVSMEPPQIPGQTIPKPKSYRLIVYGSSSLITTALIQPLPQRLMLNSMNWLTEREGAMNLEPKQLAGTPIILTDAQAKVMFVFAVILIPGALFFGGISYSLLRRRK